ncbi:MAG TPA: sulfatase [Hyphomicrobiales bacterium]|nr:sulfatase [Hyphomicrobiales bacterium]
MPAFFRHPWLLRLREPLALAFVFVVMVLPHRADWINLQSFVFVPLELWLVGLLLLVPGKRGRGLAVALGLVLGAGLIIRLADLAAFQIFARSFNPVLDAYLLADGMNLLRGAIGPIGAWLVALLLAGFALALLYAGIRALAVLRAPLQRHRRSAVLCLLAGLVLSIIWRAAGLPRTTTYFSDQLREHAASTLTSMRDLRAFRAEIAAHSAVVPQENGMFAALAGKDVAVIFVESYGRAALVNDTFASDLDAVLARGETALDAGGFGMRSAWLRSPTVGGLSWLAHATTLSGLWVDSQLRYDSLMQSDWPTLNRLFNNAGWRTVGVMPAITMPWPESRYFGYDQVYAARDLGYRGAPFNWVTMPDQYVLSAFERLERKPQPRTPVMAEIALISSHAPWTPIPHLVPWEQVGDGSIFTEQATAGPTSEEVWSDNTRIRAHYRQTLVYALDNLVSWLLAYGDDNLVVLVLGDHQPAPLVSGDTENREVPVHLIARDPAVLEAVASWQWQAGLRPDAEAPHWRMDALRDRFVAAFSGGYGGSGDADSRSEAGPGAANGSSDVNEPLTPAAAPTDPDAPPSRRP